MSDQNDISNAKRQSALNVLDDLASELDQGFLEETYTVKGVEWTIRLLNDHERNWANGYLRNASLTSMATSLRSPTLAIAIRKINGLSVEAFFTQKWQERETALSEVEKAILAATNQFVKQYFFAETLFKWLSERPPQFVQELWSKYTALDDRREAAESAMGKSLGQVGTSETPQTT